jgi:hypothetical protein
VTDTGADRKKTAENRFGSAGAFVIVLAGILLSCLTAVFGADILPDYHDKLFHLRRLAALAQTLKSGYFPARIYFVMNQGTGYAMPVFYPDFFLYIPAFLVNVGVPLGIAYDFYVILFNAVTGIVTYLSVKGILRGEKIVSAVISFVYVLSVYRLTDVYIRDAAGEYTALAFLPFVIYGFIRIYRENESEGFTESIKNASLLGISMALLAVSHVLTTMMTAGFLTVCAIILFKKTFRKNVILTLVLSVLLFLGITGYVLVPMIDYMVSDRYLVSESSNIMRGFFPGWRDLLEIIPAGSGSGIAYDMKMPTAIGPAITAILTAWVVRTFIFFIKGTISGDMKKVFPRSFPAEVILFAVTGICLFISSKYFPWTFIEQSGGLLRSVFCSVQFSWRYIGPASVCACVLASYLISDLKASSKTLSDWFMAMIMILALVPAVILQIRAISENGHAVIKSGEEIGIVSDELYFPVSWNRDAEYPESPEASGCRLDSYARNGGDWIVSIGEASENATLTFPVVYYKGYVTISASGERLKTIQSSDGRVLVELPGGFSGEVKLGFKEPSLWRFAELLSLVSIEAVILVFTRRKKRR